MRTLGPHIVLALVLASVRANAQPVTSTTPAVVEPDDPLRTLVLPTLYERGNLRLSITCAATWLTPDDGLAVTVDGVPVSAQQVTGLWGTSTDDDGNTEDTWAPTDTGFVLAPGRHHVAIEAPGCTPATFDMDAYRDHEQHAVGRLAVTEPSWLGPVGAPNGPGLMLGLLSAPTPTGPKSREVFGETAAYSPGERSMGGELSISVERKSFVFAMDFAFAAGASSGTVSGSESGTQPVASAPFTGNVYLLSSQLRLGMRLPLHEVALMGGSGIGAQMWFNDVTLGSAPSGTYLASPAPVDGSFYLPLWAGLTIKPACDWGVQLLGQYDVHPTSSDANGVEVVAGLLFQPSDACSQPAGIRISGR